MNGLVLGKFMPLHRGHLTLIDFALTYCDRLTVLLCAEANEPISGADRERWLRTTYAKHPRVTVRRFDYVDDDLPATSESSRAISALWTERLRMLAPETEMIIGSEDYVRYVAEIWGIHHRIFDLDRRTIPISA
ncbi:MAG: adenylyltransferase/cytidyltransferase family protein, partial [Bacteroidota bacterium]